MDKWGKIRRLRESDLLQPKEDMIYLPEKVVWMVEAKTWTPCLTIQTSIWWAPASVNFRNFNCRAISLLIKGMSLYKALFL